MSSVWDTTAAIGSAVGALGAWGAAMWSLKSVKVTAEATAGLTSVEVERRHTELTPEFEIRLTESLQGVNDNGELEARLIGPAGLDYLDEVVITIQDEAWIEHWGDRLPPHVTEGDARRFVWGPWQFNIRARVQIADERTTTPYAYSRITGRTVQRLQLERTRPGTWMTGTTPDVWRRQQPGPLRVLITCRRAPYQPWYLLYEVECAPPPAGGGS